MNNNVMDMAKALIVGFDYIEIKLPKQQEEVDLFKDKVLNFAKEIDDPIKYYEKLASSGLQEESVALITKITMENMNAVSSGIAEDNTQNMNGHEEKTSLNPKNKKENDEGISSSSDKIPTVVEFVENYRPAYEVVEKQKYKVKAKKAYEEIFDVANQTENMQDAQIIFEKKKLLWNIVVSDFLDTYEALYDATDPLYLHLHEQFDIYSKDYREAKSDADITYITEMLELDMIAMASRKTHVMQIIMILGNMVKAYYSNKVEIWKWKDDETVKIAVSKIANIRASAPRIVEFIKEHLNMTVGDIVSKDEFKIYLWHFSFADELFRVKALPHHQNFEACKWIIENEILSDKSILELVTFEPEKVWWPPFEDEMQSEVKETFMNKIKELNKEYLYFQYEKEASFATPDVQKAKENIKNAHEKIIK